MPNVPSGSLNWLNQLADLSVQLGKTPNAKPADLAKALNLPRPTVYSLLAFRGLFDPSALDKIRQAAGSPMEPAHPNPSTGLGAGQSRLEASAQGYTLSFNKAEALIGLIGKVPDPKAAVHEALEEIFANRLAPMHIKALVEHMAGGKPAKDFDHTQVKRKSAGTHKSTVGSPQSTGETTADKPQIEVESEPIQETDKKTKPPLNLGQRVAAAWVALSGGSQGKKAQKALKKAEAKVVKTGEKAARKGWHAALKWEHEFFKWVAGLIVPHPGHGSTGLRQLLAPLHWAVYIFCQLVVGSALLWVLAALFAPGLKPWVTFPFRYAAYWLFDFVPAWAWSLAVVHWGYAIAVGVLLLMGIFAAFKAQPLRTGLLVLLFLVGWYHLRAWGTDSPPSHEALRQAQGRPDRQAQGSPENDQGLGNSQSPTTTTETTIPPRRREATKLIKGSTSNPALSLSIGPALSQSKGSKLLTPNSSKPAPNYLPSHAWTSADGDMATVETELAAMPDGPLVIKDFPVEVDTSMQPDMAGTRTQDLTDHDRYTVRIGRDKKDIQAVVPGSSTLTLGFSKGLLGNLTDPLGGGNNGVKIIWEDIQAIHCYEWDVAGDHPRKVYVCALLIPEKVPVTVQCGSPTDMAHFVSAIEFWIRNARHGTGVPLGGLPYIHQGVLLNDGCDEKAVWENSPMGQAGLSWGDRLWSLDTNTYGKQSRDALVKSLDSLAPGQHNLYVVASKDWDRARRSEDFHSDAPFNPARRALPLFIP